MQTVISFVTENQVVLIGLALAVSEVLSLIPSVKANGIFQIVVNLLKSKKK